MAPVTPIKQSPLMLLQNAVNVCVCYEDTKNISAESAQQQLGRIRGLIMQALAGLGEPDQSTIDTARVFVRCLPAYGSLNAPDVTEREARDLAAVITHTALTWGIGDDL